MQKSKLLYTLKLFSREELYILSDFLKSPYFVSEANQRTRSALFQYIMTYYGNWEHPDLKKEKIFKKLFPNKKMTIGKMDKLMSALLKDIHHFIYIHFNEVEEEGFQETLALIKFFKRKAEYKSLGHYLEKAKKKLAACPLRGSQYYYNHFLLSDEIVQQYLIQYNKKSKLDYQAAFRPLDAFYLLKKLEQACFLLSLHRYQKPLEMPDIMEFLDTLKPLYEKQGLLDIPLVEIYYYTYELLKDEKDGEKGYWILKELIENHKSNIPVSALKVLYGLLRNFIIKEHNDGAKHLLEELFNIHRAHLEEGYLNFDQGILPSVLKNIVTMGLRVKAYDWVFNFLKEYKHKIEGTKTPQDVFNYNLASYYFAIEKYTQAMTLLVDQYEDIYYKIAARRMELKIYYETKSELLDSKIDAFKVYVFRLSKKQILDSKRASNNHFINILRQLRNPRTIHSPERLQKLLYKIEQTALLTEKDWLLAKVRMLL